MKWILVFTVLVLGLNNPLLADDVASDLCHKTVNHTPRAGVIYGDDSQTIPDPIEVPITIDLADRYNIDIPQGANFDTNFGTISIYKNDDVFYNGRDISGTIKDTCENERASTTNEPASKENKDSSDPNTGGKLSGVVSGSDQGR